MCSLIKKNLFHLFFIQLLFVSNIFCMPPSLKELIQNQLLSDKNLESTLNLYSKLLSIPPECIQGNNKFILFQNMAQVRRILLNLNLRSDKRFIYALSDANSDTSLRSETNLSQYYRKIVCYENHIISAYKDVFLRSFDTSSKLAITKQLEATSISCIDAKNGTVLTTDRNFTAIHLWKLSDLSPLGKIETEHPTAHMVIVNNLLITLNIHGTIDFYDWNYCNKIYSLQAGIKGEITTVEWLNNTSQMIIKTTNCRYIIELKDIIKTDKIIHELNIAQLAAIKCILQLQSKNPELNMVLSNIYDTLPNLIKELIKLAVKN